MTGLNNAQLYNVSKSHKLSVIDEGDLTTTVAGVIATIPIRAMLDIFQIRQCGQQDDYLHAIKEICNALLFRLAAFPEKIGSKDKKVNWTRVQGWCTAESRSSDVLEASTVEYLKCNIFLAYVQLHRTDVPREDINEAARCLLAGFEKLIDHTLSDESSRTDDAKDSYKALVSDPDGLESIVANCEKVVRSIMF